MKNLLLLITTLLLIGTNLLYSKTEAILHLDTKGHTAMIRDIIVTKSGDIISASDDKTIRVWDSVTGKEKRKILGQIGVGYEGNIYAIALSLNEKFLAVGGFISGSRDDGSRTGEIRIYNYQSGKLISVLKSPINSVSDLSFSKDGKYLISSSTDKTVKIWSVEKHFSLQDTIIYHSKYVTAVKIIKKDGEYLALSAGYDNKVLLYSIDRGEIVKEKKFDYKLNSLATTPKEIALCGFSKEIVIMNYNLKIKKIIHTETESEGLSYSPNGKYLIAGTKTSPRNINIYNTKNYSLFSSFKKHTNSTIAVGFLDNQTAISAGGANNKIYLWDIKSGRVNKKIEGVGEIVWSVGVEGDKIAWGNKGRNVYKFINLKTLQISEN